MKKRYANCKDYAIQNKKKNAKSTYAEYTYPVEFLSSIIQGRVDLRVQHLGVLSEAVKIALLGPVGMGLNEAAYWIHVQPRPVQVNWQFVPLQTCSQPPPEQVKVHTLTLAGQT